MNALSRLTDSLSTILFGIVVFVFNFAVKITVEDMQEIYILIEKEHLH